MAKSLPEMQEEVYKYCLDKNWRGPNAYPRTFLEECMLITTEVAEAAEAWRDTGHCNIYFAELSHHPDKPEGVPSELADIFIRILDTCQQYGINLEREYERKMAYNRTRPLQHGGKFA